MVNSSVCRGFPPKAPVIHARFHGDGYSVSSVAKATPDTGNANTIPTTAAINLVNMIHLPLINSTRKQPNSSEAELYTLSD